MSNELTSPRPLHELIENGFSSEEKLRYLVVGHNKQRLSKGLFWESSLGNENRDNVIFTLIDCKPKHYIIKEGRPRYDLKKLYLMCHDLTEYSFINKFMWDETQWNKLLDGPLKDHIDGWRKELERKVRHSMYAVLIQDAQDNGSPTKTTSAKYVLDKVLKEPKTSVSNTKKRTVQDDKFTPEIEDLLVDLRKASVN